MRFVFEISSFPEDTSGYNLTAYTEGNLSVIVDKSTFLNAKGILLIEFAIVMYKWLLTLEHGPSDFYYSSMDFEEEPILALFFDQDRRCFILDSAWAAGDPVPISLLDAKEAAHEYLTMLRENLCAKECRDLGRILETSVAEGSV